MSDPCLICGKPGGRHIQSRHDEWKLHRGIPLTGQTRAPTDFLLARITADEAAAREALGCLVHGDWVYTTARVLAECEAKRRIIQHLDNLRPAEEEWEQILHFLALPYADHPDYDEEWRP